MKTCFLSLFLFGVIVCTNAQPYYKVDDPESKTCIFIDTLGKELPIGKHEKLKIAQKFSEGLICINFKKYDWQPNAWGCLNAQGDTIIKGKYFEAFSFYNGVAKVSVAPMPTFVSNDEDDAEYYCQYINLEGNLINDKIFENNHSSVMDHTWAIAKFESKWFIISKKGKLKELSVDYATVEPFSDGLAKCKRMNTYTVYIDTTGWPVIDIPNENYTGTFYNGFADYSTIKGKHGFINKVGLPITPCQYEGNSIFSEDMAAIRLYGKCGYINTKGKIIIKPEYGSTFGFKEGLAWVNNNDKYGFIDKTGQVVIPLKFTMVNQSFVNGIAAVRDENSMWGYINKKGEWVIKPQFLYADYFDQFGFATVQYTDKKSYKKNKLVTYEKALISRNGKVVWYSGEKLVVK